MTALCTILIFVVISGVGWLFYLAGFRDGEKYEQTKWKMLDYVVCELIKTLQTQESEHHALTHADLAQMEQEAKNKQEDKWHKQI